MAHLLMGNLLFNLMISTTILVIVITFYDVHVATFRCELQYEHNLMDSGLYVSYGKRYFMFPIYFKLPHAQLFLLTHIVPSDLNSVLYS